MSSHEPHPSPKFATTQWSVVLAARARGSEPAERALAELCHRYWYPLYAYVRRRVGNAEEARDLTQEFFVRLLERNLVAAAEPTRGRFRTFLLSSCQNFLVNEWHRARAARRGGGRPALPLDFADGDSRYDRVPVDDATPEWLYERQWVLTLLDRVLERLRADHASRGQERTFERLKPFLAGTPPGTSQMEAARSAGMTAGAFKVALHRLRQRYRDLLWDEVAQTLDPGEDVGAEIQALLRSLAP